MNQCRTSLNNGCSPAVVHTVPVLHCIDRVFPAWTELYGWVEKMWEDPDWMSVSFLLWGRAINLVCLLDWYVTFIVQTWIWPEEVHMHPCTGYNNLHKKVRWTTLILGVSDGNANPVSSLAILCSGISLCSHRQLDWGSEIVNTASYFTYRFQGKHRTEVWR